MSKLAMLGGTPAVPSGTASAATTLWPVVTPGDEQAVSRVLRGGRLTATAAGEAEVPALEREWAAHVGVAHCVAVSSGTAALRVALGALGIGPGDEVVVPALTMNATAHAVLQCNAMPVFADIAPDTYTLDPKRVPEVLTERTAALLPVHLHGLPADMDELASTAEAGALAVVEDAAQAHGATYRGRRTGALGLAGCFSLHPSKNLPTCGEGGLITTDSGPLYEAALALRNFGERAPAGIRTYIAHGAGGNARLGPVQAAFTRSQLTRLPAYSKDRDLAVTALLGRLAALPGLRVPHVPADRSHSWHIIRLLLVPEEMDMAGIAPAAVRRALHRVLRAEGVPVSQYQVAPLPAHPAFRPADTTYEDIAARLPSTCQVIDGSLCLQRRHLNPAAADVLSLYARGFEKAWEHLGLVRDIARAQGTDDWRRHFADGAR
ncbi:DegT/DnrJ/EryC1/StrS family aminotransferase [Streptomyces sp. NPDC088115]|uniref:DegT/DnrJ/EryC1/StrS family aminotransferase n=1 Tax=Streptomyces sp. NPDC088115 TaxID=3365824 RepID=UPI00382B5129